jgi:predicted phosphodiesterase
MQLTRKDVNYLEARFKYNKDNQNFNFFLCSDIHIDNPKCQKQKFIDDLKRCQDAQGAFIIFGDYFCLMQGKKDRRGHKTAIGDFKVDDYFDAVIQYGKEVLMPFKDNFICVTDGNHETSILNHMEINPLKMLVREMGLKPEEQHLPYMGYIDLVFEQMAGGGIRRQRIFYDHGGYHGEVSKGTLAVQRYAAMSNNADIVCSGDTHHRWCLTHQFYDVNAAGKTFIRDQLHLKCGTYKEEFGSGSGWAVEKIKAPKGIGGLTLNISVGGAESSIKREVKIDS